MNRCPVCDPADYESACIHDEIDLQEGDQAIKLGELLTLRESLELGKLCSILMVNQQ